MKPYNPSCIPKISFTFLNWLEEADSVAAEGMNGTEFVLQFARIVTQWYFRR
jgi:hypothetical protein